MSPALQRPIPLGADLVIQSATKFLGGHNDLIGGAVIAADAKLAERLLLIQKAARSGAFDSWLLLRGIKTLHPRVARAQEHSGPLANLLGGASLGFAGILYLGLRVTQASRTGTWRRLTAQLDHFIELHNAAGVPTFLGACGRSSWLRARRRREPHHAPFEHDPCRHPCQGASGRRIDTEARAASVGIEDADDLRNDLEQALPRRCT